VNEEASHYAKLFGGNKIGNLTFWLPLVPQAVTHSLVHLKMGKIIARNMLSWLKLLISRYCCI